MSYILDISTAVPPFCIEREDLLSFYTKACKPADERTFQQKLSFLFKRAKIEKRYTCISDFTQTERELFTDDNYEPSVEKRMLLYKEKIKPLTFEAIDKLQASTKFQAKNITHLITVSCTGVFAPGLEFIIAEKYHLEHCEKVGLNFLGCYAALKALKQAHYIASADPKANILVLCAELCSLHFYPSEVDEEILSNLLFADGASAALICGEQSSFAKYKPVLRMDEIGSAFIPDSADLMTWNISSSAFRMHLSKHITAAIKKNIKQVLSDFLHENLAGIGFWAIHPGGVKIVEAVQQEMGLDYDQLEESMEVLRQYGNMSSPTILFILKAVFEKIKNADSNENKSVFTCAFGPGLNVEMIRLTSLHTTVPKSLASPHHHAVQI